MIYFCLQVAALAAALGQHQALSDGSQRLELGLVVIVTVHTFSVERGHLKEAVTNSYPHLAQQPSIIAAHVTAPHTTAAHATAPHTTAPHATAVPTLKVAVANCPPHVTVTRLQGGSLTLRGPMARLLESVSSKLGLRFEWVPAVDGLWGAALPNGSYNGMIGMVQRKEVDLALGPFGMTSSRAAVVTFSFPVLYGHYRILLQRGHPQHDTWSFLKPLNVTVWFGVALSFTGFALFIVLGSRNQKPTRNHKPKSLSHPRKIFGLSSEICEVRGTKKKTCGRTSSKRKTEVIESCAETMWFLYGILIQQSLSRRVLRPLPSAAVWLLASLIVMRSYSSGLTSLLAVRRVPVTIHGLQDLVQRSHLDIVFEASTAFTDYIHRAQDGVYKDMADQTARLKEIKMADLKKLGAAEVLAGGAALLTDDLICFAVIADHFKEKGACSFLLARDALWPLLLGVVGQRESDVVTRISRVIHSLVEGDIYNFWLKQEIGNYGYCQRQPTTYTKTEAIGLSAIWGVLGVLVLGEALAVVVFWAEVFWASRDGGGRKMFLRNSSRSAM